MALLQTSDALTYTRLGDESESDSDSYPFGTSFHLPLTTPSMSNSNRKKLLVKQNQNSNYSSMNENGSSSSGSGIRWSVRVLPLSGAKSKHFDDIMRKTNLQLLVLAILGFVCMIVYNETCYNRYTRTYSNVSEAHTFTILLSSWIFSVLFLWRLVYFYQVKSEKKKLVWNYPSKFVAFFRSTLKWRFLLEFVLCFMQPTPGTEGSIVHKLIIITMFCKSYLLLRHMQFTAAIYRNREQIRTKSLTFGRLEQYRVGLKTVVKTFFYLHTWILIPSMFALSFICCSYMIYVVEREELVPSDSDCGDVLVSSPFESYWNTIWFVAVSMTTIGYGDIRPATGLGRALAIIAGLVGIMISSLTVGVITNTLAPDPFEEFVINYQRRLKINRQLEHWAARIIQVAWRVHKYRSAAQRKNGHGYRKVLAWQLSPLIDRFRISQKKSQDFLLRNNSASSVSNMVRITTAIMTTLERLSHQISQMKPEEEKRDSLKQDSVHDRRSEFDLRLCALDQQLSELNRKVDLLLSR